MATYNLHALSLTGQNGAGHAEVIPENCEAVSGDVIGLQEKNKGPNRVRCRGISCILLRGGRWQGKGLDNMGLG